MWRRVIVLPLCVCLLAGCSMRTARNQVLSVRASETELLRDLLIGKRINASFADGNRLRGRVKEVQAGLLRVNIKKTSDPNLLPRGLQDIPTDRISTVQFTRYEGNKRFLYAALFFLGGVVLAVPLNIDSPTTASAAGAIGIWSGSTALGYLWGKKKDKKNVTLVIQQPEASGGPRK